MPPFLLSPLVKWSLIAAGGAMVVHWVVKETRRINEELERAGARRAFRIARRCRSCGAIPRPANTGRKSALAADAFFVGDERAEKQRKQRHSNQFEREHGTLLRDDCFFPGWSRV